MSEATVEWLSTTSAVVTLVVAVPVFWLWWEVIFGRDRRRKRWFEEARQQVGERPGVLIVDLVTEATMRPSVMRYCTQVLGLEGIPEERVFTIQRDTLLTPEDLPALALEVRAMRGEISRAGVDVLHLFFGGPTGAAAMVGAQLSNSGLVLVHQLSQPAGAFENWGPLQHS